MNGMILRTLSTTVLCLLASLPCSAQTGVSSSASAPLPPSMTVTTSGHVSDSAVGEIGQRQTRYQAAQGIAPRARIASRIQNRVQSRIQNRIDRNYSLQVDATSSLVAASNTARTAGQSAR